MTLTLNLILTLLPNVEPRLAGLIGRPAKPSNLSRI
jgi:hypothetical protein